MKRALQAPGADLLAPCPITANHDLSRFDSGKPPLDDWLRLGAIKAEGGTARTYVVCNGNTVVGYYALATGSVARIALPSALRRNTPEQVPVIVLARLAVDVGCKGQGIGKSLLQEAIQRSIQVAEIVGVRSLLVHAIDREAAAFYTKFGFQEFPDGSQTLFLPIDTIRQSLL